VSGVLAAGSIVATWPAVPFVLEEGIWEVSFEIVHQALLNPHVWQFTIRDVGATIIFRHHISLMAAAVLHKERFRFAMKSGWTTDMRLVQVAQAAGDSSGGVLNGYPIIS